MTVSATPSLIEVQTEFGGAGVLSTYVRNGSFVMTNHTTSAVSTSVPLGLFSLANTLDFTVDLNVFTANDSGNDPSIGQCGVRCYANGQLEEYALLLGDTDRSPEWGDPQIASVGSNYHIKFDYVSGDVYDLSAGNVTTAEWTQVNITRLFAFSQSGTGSKNGAYNMKISYDGGSTTHDNADITFNIVISP